MRAALGEMILGRFADEESSSSVGRATARKAQNEGVLDAPVAPEWPGDLMLRHRPRGPFSRDRAGDHREQAEVRPFPYLELIQAALREGEINSAKKLLSLATGPGQQMSDDLARLQLLLGPARVRRSPVKGVDRTPEFSWLKVHGAEYEGQWVAVSGNQLVAHAGRLRDLLAELKTLSLDRRPLIHKIS